MFCSWNLTPSQIVCFGLVSWLRSARSVTKWSNVSWLILRLHCHYLCLQPYSFLEYISKYMRTRSLWTWMDELKWTCKEATKRASWCFSNNTVWDFQTARFNKSLTPKLHRICFRCVSAPLQLWRSGPFRSRYARLLFCAEYQSVPQRTRNQRKYRCPKGLHYSCGNLSARFHNLWLEWIIYTAKYVLQNPGLKISESLNHVLVLHNFN